MTIAIEARNVAFSFGTTPALRGASIAVDSGEILAIMGPSGSGKSTLLHCLAGILVPDSGEILFDLTRVDSMTETQRSALRRTASGSCSNSVSSSPNSPPLRTWRCRCC